MNKKDMTLKINALKIEGLNFAEDTEVNNDVLTGILSLAKAKEDADALVEDLNTSNSELTEQIAQLKKSGGKFVSPVVKVKGKEYIFQDPKFKLPKQEATTAEEVAERNEDKEIAECIKRGALVLKKGGKDA